MDKNLEKTIAILFPAFELILSKKLLKQLVRIQENELLSFHFGFNLFVRNNILNTESPLYSILTESGFTCKDDMSEMILKLFHRYLNTKSEYI